MMKAVKKLLCLAFLIVLSVALVGCGETEKEKPDLGKLKGLNYSNKYFGLELSLPNGWSVQDQETQAKLTEKGKNLVAGDNKNQQAMLDESAKNALYFLTVFKYPLGTPGKYNPNFMGIAENVELFAGIKTGKDYLLNSKSLLENSNLEYLFPKDIYSETIGNKQFDVMETELNLGPVVVKQKYYSAIIKGYALNFIISYTNDEELESLNEIIKTIKIGAN